MGNKAETTTDEEGVPDDAAAAEPAAATPVGPGSDLTMLSRCVGLGGPPACPLSSAAAGACDQAQRSRVAIQSGATRPQV